MAPPGSHQPGRPAGAGNEGVGGNIQREMEIGARGVPEIAFHRFLVGKGDGVHDEVEPPPAGLDLGEEIVELRVVADVELFDEARPDRLGQGMNPFLQRLAEIVEPELGPLALTGPGHTPCDRFLVGDAQDQPFPALQNAHEIPPWFRLPPILTGNTGKNT
jgi:hypothetical protein